MVPTKAQQGQRQADVVVEIAFRRRRRAAGSSPAWARGMARSICVTVVSCRCCRSPQSAAGEAGTPGAPVRPRAPSACRHDLRGQAGSRESPARRRRPPRRARRAKSCAETFAGQRDEQVAGLDRGCRSTPGSPRRPRRTARTARRRPHPGTEHRGLRHGDAEAIAAPRALHGRKMANAAADFLVGLVPLPASRITSAGSAADRPAIASPRSAITRAGGAPAMRSARMREGSSLRGLSLVRITLRRPGGARDVPIRGACRIAVAAGAEQRHQAIAAGIRPAVAGREAPFERVGVCA